MAASTNDVITGACDDFMQFENALKEIRRFDDSIIYELNTIVPTKSFKVDTTEKCKNLYEQLTHVYSERERAIKTCITSASREVNHLRSLRLKEENQDNPEIIRQLRNSQTKLRMMQRELSVEEVVRDRSWKVFYERCRDSYKPDRPLV